jgi:hypothetical protein
VALTPPAGATLRYGPIQISGNLQTQNLFRVPDLDQWSIVQQRNTFRLQYEHQLVEGGLLFKETPIPFVTEANLFAYYRFVYDSVFDMAPGGHLQASDGSPAGRLEDLPNGVRRNVAMENVLREFFVDAKIAGLPLSLRIGRQQMNWGEADSFRALDSVNPIDLTWHFQQEAGLLGKAGFDELRVPMWAVKALYRIGTIGPFSNTFVEAYDNPFDFQQSKIRFLPQSPWSVSVRNPFRPGLVIDAGALQGGPPGLVLLEPCFDRTGRPVSNSAGQVDFSRASETGFCDAHGPRTSLRQGLFDRHDPADVNQFGVRLGSSIGGFQFTANYIRRRHYFEIPTAGSARVRQGALLANPADFVSLDLIDRGQPSHTAHDPITGQDTTVLGFIRIPIEFYMPQVHVFGFSANYFEELTGSVLRAEATYTLGFPISDLADPNGIVKKDVLLAMIGFDRPTWITWLNRRATWLISAQLFVNWIPGHDDTLVQLPNSNLIPGQFRDEPTIDRVKEVEMLSTLIATTFYRGGSVVPIVAIIPQWSYMPTFAFLGAVDWYITNNWILTPAIRIYTTPDGGVVDEPYGIGRLGKWDEVQLKLTYQF